ncbi:unnamed protein product [Effrenium voratum]|nr:unnamed protein product [Effrenium voratum]
MLTQLNRWISGNASGGCEEQKLREISLEYQEAELVSATQNFDPCRRLGSGNYGCVYRATLKDGHEVAIKVIEVDEEDTSGFADEVLVLSKFRHPNLVTLMGWGSGLDEDGCGRRYLVYELLEGGDVAGRLAKARGKNGTVTPFSWMERLWVALDAACGLSHMHNSTPKAFHRDIKSANILLDRSGTAKMADFGLSGIAKNKNKLNMTCDQISGTPGYACPHYIKTGKVTEQTEVYAYGMVVMEMLLNSMPACMGQNGTIMYPIFQIVMPQAEGALQRATAAADAKAEWPPPVARDVAELSLVCSEHEDGSAMSTPLLHYFRVADLHVSPALQKKAAELGFTLLGSEICFNIQARGALDAEETKKLEYLLRETFEPEKFGQSSFLSGTVLEVGPRQQFTSAWSTNAVSICHSIALSKIVRIDARQKMPKKRTSPDLSEPPTWNLSGFPRNHRNHPKICDGESEFEPRVDMAP